MPDQGTTNFSQKVQKKNIYCLQVPPMNSLRGAKRMLLDQGQINDVVETSVWQLESRRRSVAAWVSGSVGKKVMQFYGWNTTPYCNASPGPPWRHQEKGLVWEPLNLPASAPTETVRSSLNRPVLCPNEVQTLVDNAFLELLNSL